MRILTLILSAVVAVGVAGCGSVPLQPAPQRTAFNGFATLASVGGFEWVAAPTWTRLAAARHTATRALDAGRITLPVARLVQTQADALRKLLDDAIATAAGKVDVDLTAALARADDVARAALAASIAAAEQRAE